MTDSSFSLMINEPTSILTFGDPTYTDPTLTINETSSTSLTIKDPFPTMTGLLAQQTAEELIQIQCLSSILIPLPCDDVIKPNSNSGIVAKVVFLSINPKSSNEPDGTLFWFACDRPINEVVLAIVKQEDVAIALENVAIHIAEVNWSTLNLRHHPGPVTHIPHPFYTVVAYFHHRPI